MWKQAFTSGLPGKGAKKCCSMVFGGAGGSTPLAPVSPSRWCTNVCSRFQFRLQPGLIPGDLCVPCPSPPIPSLADSWSKLIWHWSWGKLVQNSSEFAALSCFRVNDLIQSRNDHPDKATEVHGLRRVKICLGLHCQEFCYSDNNF